MQLVAKLNDWAHHHQAMWIDALRVLLGGFIFYKGMYFMEHTSIILELIQSVNSEWAMVGIAHYVAMAHLAGGVLIIIGLLTRIAILVQLPVLIGAVIFNALNAAAPMELTAAIVALVLLIAFLLYGSGKYSIDHFIGRDQGQDF
ncbi:MAG: DoxX family protein [Flammeovirgaceae bacterium]